MTRGEVTPIWKAPKKPKPARKPLPHASPKRIAEKPIRDAFRQAILEEYGYMCQGPKRGLPELCASVDITRPSLEIHEPDQRSTHPGSHVRSTKAVPLCQRHHDQCSSPVGEMRELVERVGLLIRATS